MVSETVPLFQPCKIPKSREGKPEFTQWWMTEMELKPRTLDLQLMFKEQQLIQVSWAWSDTFRARGWNFITKQSSSDFILQTRGFQTFLATLVNKNSGFHHDSVCTPKSKSFTKQYLTLYNMQSPLKHSDMFCSINFYLYAGHTC